MSEYSKVEYKVMVFVTTLYYSKRDTKKALKEISRLFKDILNFSIEVTEYNHEEWWTPEPLYEKEIRLEEQKAPYGDKIYIGFSTDDRPEATTIKEFIDFFLKKNISYLEKNYKSDIYVTLSN